MSLFIYFFLLFSSLLLDSPFCENLANSIRKPVRATTGARDRGGCHSARGGRCVVGEMRRETAAS
jgi:hypothetical protein